MAYIGNRPVSATFAVDTFSGNGSTDTFTLRYAPASESSILVFVNDVRQNTSSYSLSDANITLTPPPAAGTNNIEVVFLGIGSTPYAVNAGSIGENELKDGSVSGNKLQSNIIRANNIVNGTINNSKLVDANITGAKLVANTVTTRELSDNAILQNNITNGAVTSSKLASNLSLSGNLTIGAGNLTVSGTVSATDFNSTSDITLKDNMLIISNPMETINQINGFSFNWKKDGKKSYGLSAQEVEKILPDIVVTHSDGYKGINYLNIIAFLLEATKNLQKQIDELKKK